MAGSGLAPSPDPRPAPRPIPVAAARPHLRFWSRSCTASGQIRIAGHAGGERRCPAGSALGSPRLEHVNQDTSGKGREARAGLKQPDGAALAWVPPRNGASMFKRSHSSDRLPRHRPLRRRHARGAGAHRLHVADRGAPLTPARSSCTRATTAPSCLIVAEGEVRVTRHSPPASRSWPCWVAATSSARSPSSRARRAPPRSRP